MPMPHGCLYYHRACVGVPECVCTGMCVGHTTVTTQRRDSDAQCDRGAAAAAVEVRRLQRLSLPCCSRHSTAVQGRVRRWWVWTARECLPRWVGVIDSSSCVRAAAAAASSPSSSSAAPRTRRWCGRVAGGRPGSTAACSLTAPAAAAGGAGAAAAGAGGGVPLALAWALWAVWPPATRYGATSTRHPLPLPPTHTPPGALPTWCVGGVAPCHVVCCRRSALARRLHGFTGPAPFGPRGSSSGCVHILLGAAGGGHVWHLPHAAAVAA